MVICVARVLFGACIIYTCKLFGTIVAAHLLLFLELGLFSDHQLLL